MCVLAVGAIATTGTVRESASVLACGLLGIAVLDVVVTVVEHQLTSRHNQIEHVVAESHKRASVWNFHLSKALGIAQDEAGNTEGALAVVGPTTAPVRVKRHPEAPALLASGVLDVEHYAAYVGAEFATALDAASHYLTTGARNGLEPTPFLDLSTLPADARSALAQENPGPLLEYLRSSEAFEASLSDLFVGRHSSVSAEDASAHPGGVLGAFLERADARTTVPVALDAPNHGALVGEVREVLTRHARDTRRMSRLAGPRTTETWDSTAEASWIRTVRASIDGDLPTVSVVLPVRDREDLVVEAIRSVQGQTHARWELVVVDDGSTDATAGRVAELAKEDVRIRLVAGTGRGVSHARNLGLDAATGEYIAFLDSDNVWVPGYLELVIAAMMREDLAAAYAATEMRSASGLSYRAYPGGREDLLMLNHVDLNVLVVRADVLAGGVRFDEDLRRWVDHDFVLQVARVAEPVLLPFVGCRYDDSREAADRITVRETEHWQWVVLGKHWVDWAAAPQLVTGRLSVVIPTYNDSRMTISAVESVLRDADLSGLDIEVVVVDNGSRIEVGQRLLRRFGVGGRVRYLRLPRNLNFATGSNAGAAVATGELILFLNNDTGVRDGALARLVARMADPGVLGAQPLLLYGDETIQTAGTVFTVRDHVPNHLLVGHPAADALPLTDVSFDAVSAAALIMRTADVRRLRGFDPLFVNGMEDVDLCLRAREEIGGAFVVVPTARVTHFESKTPGRGANVAENRRLFLDRWRGRLPGPQPQPFAVAGFTVAHVGTVNPTHPAPRPVIVRDLEDARVRWGIKISSVGGSRGDQWGDTHFAESLRTALERLGHRAVVHRHGTHHSEATAFDDVSLVIRGIDRTRPVPGQINILWVISHPDDVSVEEVREYDLVFAASEAWCRKMSDLADRPVVPLLQATDPHRFHSDVPAIRHDVAIFVGGTHPGRSRKIIDDALSAGVEVGVYGPGWEGSLPEGALRGQYVANTELAGHYRGARRVLADHWEAMAAEGFVQNRIFDAVASGAHVVSDQIAGVEEIFGNAVRTYRSASELAFLCSPESDVLFPDSAEMEAIAGRVREAHSFDRRAEQLSAAVVARGLCKGAPSHGPVREALSSSDLW